MTKKNFKFQYCFIKQINGKENTQEFFNFAPFISEFVMLPKNELVLNMYDFKAKMEEINSIDKRFLHISLVKMIDKAMPKKVFEDDRESLDIEIKDDEYLGMEVHMLYDMNNKVLMVQSTRESLSIKNISCYLNEFAHKLNLINDSQILEIQPILDSKVLSSNSIVRKIDLRFANIENVEPKETDNIFGVLNVFNKFNAVSGAITISAGRTKKELDSQEIIDAIDIVKQINNTYKNCISCARVSYTENDNSFVYDLFDDVMNDIGHVEVAPRESIKFENIELEMLRLYNKKLTHINNVINYNKVINYG